MNVTREPGVSGTVPTKDATIQLDHGPLHILFFLTTAFGLVQF